MAARYDNFTNFAHKNFAGDERNERVEVRLNNQVKPVETEGNMQSLVIIFLGEEKTINVRTECSVLKSGAIVLS